MLEVLSSQILRRRAGGGARQGFKALARAEERAIRGITADDSFVQRQGRCYGWYAWTGTVPSSSGRGGVTGDYISRLNRQWPASRPARRLHSSWMVSVVTSQGMCIAAVKPGGGRGAYAWTDNCNLQPLVHHRSLRGGTIQTNRELTLPRDLELRRPKIEGRVGDHVGGTGDFRGLSTSLESASREWHCVRFRVQRHWMILAEAVRLSVQYVRRSPYVRERSQYVSRRQYGRGDSTSVGGSTAAEPVRQSEAVRPSGTVRQLDLCGAVGLAAVDGDASRGNASVCLKSSPVKSCDEGREVAQEDSRRLQERRRWRFEAKTVDGSFAQRQGRRYGWYAWTGTVPLFSGRGGVTGDYRTDNGLPAGQPAGYTQVGW